MHEPLSGRRILVIEDEYFIASDLRRALTAAGAEVIGPAAGVDDGLRLLDGAAVVDGAMLDVNVGGADVFPIADLLRRRGVPYLFITGYDSWALPDEYQATPRVAKPYRIDTVVTMIARLMDEPA